jgi:hypothetical protein
MSVKEAAEKARAALERSKLGEQRHGAAGVGAGPVRLLRATVNKEFLGGAHPYFTEFVS